MTTNVKACDNLLRVDMALKSIIQSGNPESKLFQVYFYLEKIAYKNKLNLKTKYFLHLSKETFFLSPKFLTILCRFGTIEV